MLQRFEGNVSRRNFLKGAAITGVTMAGGATMLPGCTPSEKTQSANSLSLYPEYDIPGRISLAEFKESSAKAEPITSYDKEETYDVVVIGAGVGGVPAAISAAETGANVCLIQKEANPVGQGSGCCCINSEETDKLGTVHLMHSLREYCSYRSNWELNMVWANNCSEAVSWYIEKCKEAGMVEGVDFSSKPLGKFEFPEGNATTTMYDFTGGMNNPTVALGKKFGEKVNVHYNCPGVQLITEESKVTGVYAEDKNGSIIRINAAKGIILATGDYQNNPAMVDKYVPDAQPFERKQVNKTGDGHLMGLMVGAKMQNAGHTKMIHNKNWGANVTVMTSVPLLAVNLDGKRFTAEDAQFSVRNNLVRTQPNNVWITIMDSNYEDQLTSMGEKPTGISQLEEIGESGGVYKADTIEELAKKIGVPPENLSETVDRYNELCSAGGDEDFGKPTKYMAPVDTPPYYGLHREYALSAITSGLEINSQAQVLNIDFEPIDGLYAIGNCSGPFYGCIDYPMNIAGLSVSRCITFGYITGAYVASK